MDLEQVESIPDPSLPSGTDILDLFSRNDAVGARTPSSAWIARGARTVSRRLSGAQRLVSSHGAVGKLGGAPRGQAGAVVLATFHRIVAIEGIIRC